MITVNELLVRARKERSDYLARLLSNIAAKVHGWIVAREARAQLEAMTDRELADIGLTRGDIENVVVGNDVSVRREAA